MTVRSDVPGFSRPARKRSAGPLARVAVGILVVAGLVAGQASTAMGDVESGKRSSDKITSDNSNSADVTTDGCRGASVRTLSQGGPFPGLQTLVHIEVTSAPYKECRAVGRIVYVKSKTGALQYGPWADGGRGGYDSYNVNNVYRCYTEFVVQHKDASALYLRLFPSYARNASVRPTHCPAP